MSFQVQFVKLEYVAKQELAADLDASLKNLTLYAKLMTQLQASEQGRELFELLARSVK